MGSKLRIALFGLLVLLMFGSRFLHFVPPGHVGVAVLYGEVLENGYAEGRHFPTNPFYEWTDMDVRPQAHRLSTEVPTGDGRISNVDLAIQYRLDAELAPTIFREIGKEDRVVGTLLVPAVRAKSRELGTRIPSADQLNRLEIRDKLASELRDALSMLSARGLIVDDVQIRGVEPPPAVAEAIEKMNERPRAELFGRALDQTS